MINIYENHMYTYNHIYVYVTEKETCNCPVNE